MKLSKQERIGLMIIVAVVILALGAFLIVKPKIEDAIRNKETMEKTQKNYDEKKAKADTKEPLRTQILEAYEEGKQKADMFFEEMKPYEVDDMFREFLENRSYTKPGNPSPEEKANILIEQVNVTGPSTKTLSAKFTETKEISYPLKGFATQGGVTISEEEQAARARKAKLKSILSGSQTIGANTVSFTAQAISQDDFIKLADEFNNYIREENGKKVRKAMSITGLTLEYPEIRKKYDKMVDQITKEAKEAGENALRENAGVNPSAGGSTPSNIPSLTPGNDEEQKAALSDYLFEWTNTLTFYSIQRMQDPTPILDAQDGR